MFKHACRSAQHLASHAIPAEHMEHEREREIEMRSWTVNSCFLNLSIKIQIAILCSVSFAYKLWYELTWLGSVARALYA